MRILEGHPIKRTLAVGTTSSSRFSSRTTSGDNPCSKTRIYTQMSEVLGFVLRWLASLIRGLMAEDGRETIDTVDKAGRRSSLSIMDSTCPTMVCLARTGVPNPDIRLLRAL